MSRPVGPAHPANPCPAFEAPHQLASAIEHGGPKQPKEDHVNDNRNALDPGDISCELQDGDVKLDAVRLKAESFLPLSPEDVDELVNAVRVAHPEATEFDKASMGNRLFFGRIDSEWPTPEAIKAYHQSYSRWIADLKTFVADAQLRLAPRAVSVELDLIISNEGVEPADGVIVSIETMGGFLLSQIEPNDNAPAKLEPYPGPPTPPEPIWKIPRPQVGAWASANRIGDAMLAAARASGSPNLFNSFENLGDRNRLAATSAIVTPSSAIPCERPSADSKPGDRHKFYRRIPRARWRHAGSLNAPSFSTASIPSRFRCG
jgi:hypothetical protein